MQTPNAKCVGYFQSTYAMEKIGIGCPIDGFTHRRLRALQSTACALLPAPGRFDLIHSFNAVVLNRTPWVVTFESLLPRLWGAPWLGDLLWRRLASNDCRAIIAMSENAKLHLQLRNQQRQNLRAVLDKVTLIEPAVQDYPELYERRLAAIQQGRFADTPFKLLFVGHDFFRKGGGIVLRAFEALHKELPMELTVISRMSADNYMRETTSQDRDRALEQFHHLGVRHLESAPPGEVRRLMAESHACLLPTLDDSFGYSVIEAMSVGTPTIATALRAIPELIEHAKNGWLIPVETTPEKRLVMQAATEERLAAALADMLRGFTKDTPLASMAQNARDVYLKRFTQARLARQLQQVYARAINT